MADTLLKWSEDAWADFVKSDSLCVSVAYLSLGHRLKLTRHNMSCCEVPTLERPNRPLCSIDGCFRCLHNRLGGCGGSGDTKLHITALDAAPMPACTMEHFLCRLPSHIDVGLHGKYLPAEIIYLWLIQLG